MGESVREALVQREPGSEGVTEEDPLREGVEDTLGEDVGEKSAMERELLVEDKQRVGEGDKLPVAV